ncbi:uncharacterized protein LOC112140099 [Oryzias melastigma]|uniref:uncharacterized protein LOC112140099 n=1 Tax=Oryzias melastigma TaxID=30732 RepID=UPI00168D0B55|nr:uncharacterized protein LOC112140099 [Oryzias melastigma]
MAKAVMEAFPQMPEIEFGTAPQQIGKERKDWALKLLKASVFNAETSCALCALVKPPGLGPALTNWIMCDTCSRWFHTQCLEMDKEQMQEAKYGDWNCSLCL